MYFLGLLFLCAGALASTVPQDEKPFYHLEDAETHFEKFIVTHNKLYPDEAERKLRFDIFKHTLAKINRLNADPTETAHFDINRFADLTTEEMKTFMGFKPLPSDKISNVTKPEPVDMDDSFDWRDHKAVTGIKDQKNCGSCWTFSTTGTVEGAYAIKHKQLEEFSEQQLLDCDYLGHGCAGGWMLKALQYLKQAGGSVTEKGYPYKAVQGNCLIDPKEIKAKVTGYIAGDISSEEALRKQLKNVGPMAIALHAQSMFPYKKGVLQKCGHGKLNHAVLLVGYGTDNGVPYWIIKNSWGPTFGEAGYIRVKRGINACGLVNQAAVIAQVA